MLEKVGLNVRHFLFKKRKELCMNVKITLLKSLLTFSNRVFNPTSTCIYAIGNFWYSIKVDV